MSEWIGEPTRTLDELAAFDAMRRFLQIWWEIGGRSEDSIAAILGSANRTHGIEQGAPLDIALWHDWRDAVTNVLTLGSKSDFDPLADDDLAASQLVRKS